MNLKFEKGHGDTFTSDEFRKHVLEFRTLMSSKKYWEQDEDTIKRGIEPLAYVYMHTIEDEEYDKDTLASIFKSTSIEYDMRERYMMKIF